MFVTHGEEASALAFEELLKQRGHNTFVPYSGDAWGLIPDKQTESGPRAPAEKKKDKARKAETSMTALSAALARLTRVVEAGGGLGNKL